MRVRRCCYVHAKSRLATRAGMWVVFSLFMPALIACGRFGVHDSTEVHYTPPFIPVTFSFSTDGGISVSAGASVTTPIGTFSLDESVSSPLGDGSTRLSIIHSVNGSEVKDVYDIDETGPMNVCLDGRFFETIGTRETIITALDNVSIIRIIKGGGQCPAEPSSSSTALSAPTTPPPPPTQPATTSPIPSSITPTAATPPSSQCVFLYPNQLNCTSSDPEVTLEGDFTDDTTGCVFIDQVVWGDGSSQTFDINGGPAGPVFVSHHTYLESGTFSITLNATVASGPCTAFPGYYTFTFN
jgi:hypothetical protein